MVMEGWIWFSFIFHFCMHLVRLSISSITIIEYFCISFVSVFKYNVKLIHYGNTRMKNNMNEWMSKTSNLREIICEFLLRQWNIWKWKIRFGSSIHGSYDCWCHVLLFLFDKMTWMLDILVWTCFCSVIYFF